MPAEPPGSASNSLTLAGESLRPGESHVSAAERRPPAAVLQNRTPGLSTSTQIQQAGGRDSSQSAGATSAVLRGRDLLDAVPLYTTEGGVTAAKGRRTQARHRQWCAVKRVANECGHLLKI